MCSFSPNSLLLGVLNALKNGRLGAGWSGRVPGRLVSHFLSFVSQFFSFVSQAGCLWSGSRLACLPLPFICLPGWVLVVGFPAGLSPTSSSFHLSPTSFHLSPRLGACGPGWLVSHLPFILGACGRVPGHFLSFVSQAGCLWSGSRPACLPLLFICLPLLFCLWLGSRPACLPLPLMCVEKLLFICLPLLFICLPGWVLVVGFPGGLS